MQGRVHMNRNKFGKRLMFQKLQLEYAIHATMLLGQIECQLQEISSLLC